MTFDDLNRVTTITHRGAAGETLTSLTYTLDDTGRRTAINESTGRSSNYTYDELYRLTGESITDNEVGNHSASYEYNAVSNRIADTVNGTSSNYTYDDNDRLTNHGLDTYSYDDNGNTVTEVVNGQSNSYAYDSQNRLIEANMGGVVQAMAYDPDGVRIQKSSNGDTTDYLTDSNRDYAQVLYERSAMSELNYTFGTDLVGLSTRVENFTYHTDALGSTRLLTDTSGSVADDVRYDAWGEMLSGGDVVENQYLYTGEQFDGGLGKTYLRARYYDAGVGRFGSMDKWGGKNKIPTTLNKYIYADEDPVNLVDPSGYFSIGSLMRALDVASSMLTVVESSASIFGWSGASPMDESDTSEYLWDILMSYAISGVNSSVGAGATSSGIAPVSTVGSGAEHHTVPIYVCGAFTQTYSRVNTQDHKDLHRQLYMYSTAVNIAGKSIDLIFKKPRSRSKRTPIQRLARTKTGRAAISIGLERFYQIEDYWDVGSPTIGSVFTFEAPRFISKRKNSSYDQKCQRK